MFRGMDKESGKHFNSLPQITSISLSLSVSLSRTYSHVETHTHTPFIFTNLNLIVFPLMKLLVKLYFSKRDKEG